MQNRLLASIAKLLLKRLMIAVPTLLLVSLICFVLIHSAPGDAFSELSQDAKISQETVQRLRQQYGLDRPLMARYGDWLAHAVRGDLGVSIGEKIAVTKLIGMRLGNTLRLSVLALLLALLIALPLGALSAKSPGSWLDRSVSAFSLLSLSTPRIVFALLALLFASKTQWFSIGGVGSSDPAAGWMRSWMDMLHHLILPSIVMSLPLAAVYLRQTRAGLIEVLQADFIRTARAKGLSEWQIIGKHAARVAAAPMITLFGYAIATLLSGSVIVEAVMSYPGIGQLAVTATKVRDMPVLMGVVMLTALMMMIGNVIAEILHVIADPRLRENA